MDFGNFDLGFFFAQYHWFMFFSAAIIGTFLGGLFFLSFDKMVSFSNNLSKGIRVYLYFIVIQVVFLFSVSIFFSTLWPYSLPQGKSVFTIGEIIDKNFSFVEKMITSIYMFRFFLMLVMAFLCVTSLIFSAHKILKASRHEIQKIIRTF